MTYILGISYNYHDSSAVLLKDGEIVSACQEERFSRIKHDRSFPVNSISYILDSESIDISQLSLVVINEEPLLKLLRQLKSVFHSLCHFKIGALKMFLQNISSYDYTSLQVAQRFASNKLIQHQLVTSLRRKIIFSRHHLSHAASAYFPSGFSDAVVLCIDGVGESVCTSAWQASNGCLSHLWSTHYPNSLGLLYSAFTYYCGFKVNSGEYKLMGLAPYGKPIYSKLITDNLLSSSEDHRFRLSMDYFSFDYSDIMINQKFIDLFGMPARLPESDISQFYKDIAASIQNVCEQVVYFLATEAKKSFPSPNLVMAGGVALNCVSNGKLLNSSLFENIWVQPASGDAGTALGAAYLGQQLLENNSFPLNIEEDKMKSCYLGPKYTQQETQSLLDSLGSNYLYYHDTEIFDYVASLIADGQVVGWFDGPMEFGPRALGSRSILGDPRDPEKQKSMNLKIKFRESFRPFAPTILEEKVSEYFEGGKKSPYMLFTFNVNNSDSHGIDIALPAITHVDGSARVQTISESTSPRYYKLLSSFYEQTGCPVLINTSFNLRGEPIVCSPVDAFDCFMRSNIDALVVNNFVLLKSGQDKSICQKYVVGSSVLD